MKTPIVDFVRRYAASGTSRLHMPGHKGCGPLGCEQWDITEIQGADELYEAEGVIAESEANATALFGTAHTYYSTEGSSQCIRAMLALALQSAKPTGQRPVLCAARNAHKALLYAAALLDFDIQWLWPAADAAGALCSCPVTPAELEAALTAGERAGQAPFAVYVTSPDYLGGVQDIAGLARVCTAHGLPLLVDNAHGAYLRFLPEDRHPVALGAAICCDTAHKTLPVLTGGAYLHLGQNAPVQDEAAVRNTLNLFGSTSPSYLILQSLDAANAALAGEWPRQLAECCAALETLRQALNAFAPGFARAGNAPDREPLKLTLDAAAVGYTGGELAQTLRSRAIECEYADPRYVVLMPTPANRPEDFARLREALLSLPKRPPLAVQSDAALFRALAGQQAQTPPGCTIREAIFAPQEMVPARDAVGRICAMPTVSCPPAIPITVSGERVTPAAVQLMERYGIQKLSVRKALK